MTDPQQATCATCPHRGCEQCRIHAPVAIPMQRPDGYGNMHTEVETWFPYVADGDWCSEHPDRRNQ